MTVLPVETVHAAEEEEMLLRDVVVVRVNMLVVQPDQNYMVVADH